MLHRPENQWYKISLHMRWIQAFSNYSDNDIGTVKKMIVSEMI